ncbi:ParA family protein [Actinomadura atramentaria]|uniref:ParA family protein n=1 Tax=Actinomadura atramentaria TaxID=1990 RepID=UPI0003691478|nr:ParA family protein [Actinomadura atramentaria]
MTDDVPWWVINFLKGGSRKTTTTMFVAFALADDGEDVLVIDADDGTQGVTDWAGEVYGNGETLPFDVVQWSPGQGLLVPFINQAVERFSPDRVLIDVGGEAPHVLKQALTRASLLISPLGGERGELSRVPATQVIAMNAGVRQIAVITRTPDPGRGLARKCRTEVTKAGIEMLETEVQQNLDIYSHVWGTIPPTLGVYRKVTDEIKARVKHGK